MTELLTLGCGAGTQSMAIYYLMRDGAIPRADAAIFADTGAEPADVYDNVRFLQREFESIGVPFYIVGRNGADTDLCADVLDRHTYATIPAFTIIERTVRVPLWWQRCHCPWARIVGVGGPGGVTALQRFAPGVTRDQITHHRAHHLDSGDCDLCLSDSSAESAFTGDQRAALMLAETGLAAVPPDHPECRSTGRIPTRWHSYTQREKGRIKRECTGKYKIEPIERQIRILLGAREWDVPCRFCQGSGYRVAPWDVAAGVGRCGVCWGRGMRHRVGRAPRGSRVRHIIGFSAEEIIDRATTTGFASTTTPIYPLAELGYTRADCEDIIRRNGRTPRKSACVPCPFHGNAYWRWLRDHRPAEWRTALEFDRAIRVMPGGQGHRFLHESCVPLDQAPIDRPTRAELASAQGDLFHQREVGSPTGCNPHGCRAGERDEPIIDLGMPPVLPRQVGHPHPASTEGTAA